MPPPLAVLALRLAPPLARAVVPGWVVIPAWAMPAVLGPTRAPRWTRPDTPTCEPVAVTPKPA
jgi:hypothetical protein